MLFRVFFHKKAAKEIGKIDPQNRERIGKEISELEKMPQKGKHLHYCNFWSLRIGEYRAIYEIKKQENSIIVLFAGHRKNVYEDFTKLF
ncbi:MAG: type II toxin-antitoxin system RelE/ParE family toxin [archaeon]